MLQTKYVHRNDGLIEVIDLHHIPHHDLTVRLPAHIVKEAMREAACRRQSLTLLIARALLHTLSEEVPTPHGAEGSAAEGSVPREQG